MKILLLLIVLFASSCYLTDTQFVDECMSSQETLLDMEKITKDVSGTLKELKIRHWLDSGTLLGAYRFGSHMPYDDDIDFGVMRDDYQAHKVELHDRLTELGYEIRALDSDPNGTVIPQIHFRNGPQRTHLDLFLFEPFPGKKNYLRLSSAYWHQKANSAGHEGLGFPEDIIFNPDGSIGKIWLLGVEYGVPVNLTAYFKRWYNEPNILTNFRMSQAHGGNICSSPVSVNNIQNRRKLLDKMFDHLEKVYGSRFKRTDSRLY